MLNYGRLSRRGSRLWVASSIEGGLSGRRYFLLSKEGIFGGWNLGGQKYLMARLHGGNPEVFG